MMWKRKGKVLHGPTCGGLKRARKGMEVCEVRLRRRRKQEVSQRLSWGHLDVKLDLDVTLRF
jgi:hypothetical protein